MRTLHCDLETYSSVSLPDCGVYRYCESPDFEILILGYAYDDEPVQVIDLTKEEMPSSLRQDFLHNPDVQKMGWNISFEIACFTRYFGQEIDPAEWMDVMIVAAELGLPRSLKDVGLALGLPQDEVKDRRGKALIRYFSQPCAPTRANGGRTRNLPTDDQLKWQEYMEYNRQDVVAERAIWKKLKGYPLPESEQAAWVLDQQINRRGVLCDRTLAAQAVRMSREHTALLMDELRRITGLENPNSLVQLKAWFGTDAPLDEAAVTEMLATETDPARRRVLEIRREIGKSSVKKYEAMLNGMCADDRCRGLFQFYGANRTGRWSGRNLQTQNLPQNHLDDLSTARSIAREGDREGLEMLYGSVPDTLSQLIRTAFIPKAGCVFAVADFSAIEARVIAWLAGEKWRMDLFAAGGDIYCQSASKMFHVPVVKHGVNGHLRQKGKIAELACLAENSPVLTDRGLVPIQNVTTDMKLWDGEEWVTHEGVIYQGEREVITYGGLTATSDHPVWTEYGVLPFGDAAVRGARLCKTGTGRKTVRLGDDHQPGETVETGMDTPRGADGMRWLRGETMDRPRQPDARTIQGMPAVLAAETDSKVARQTADRREAAVREPEGQGVPELRRAGDPVRISERDGSGAVHDPGIRPSNEGDGNRPDRRERRLRAGEPALRGPSDELRKSAQMRADEIRAEVLAIRLHNGDPETVGRHDAGRDHPGRGDGGFRETEGMAHHRRTARVYDIRNAGRHHRFTVSDVLVHNCGYGGNTGAMINMGALQMGLTEDELPGIVEKWREASPRICALWRDLGDAALAATAHRETVDLPHGVRLWRSGKLLHMRLPSGRCIRYFSPEITENRFGGPSLAYEAYDMGRWGKAETWGGKLTENLVQATARDCLLAAMTRVSKRYPDIVMHVHDEMIVEVPENEAEEALAFICGEMGKEIEWAPRLLLRGDGYLCEWYRKD